MRLLETTTGQLVEKTPEDMRKENISYAILSHTWGADEVEFRDIVHGTEDTKAPKSRLKVHSACKQALCDGHKYIWIDTCCIDKSSSAELSEAINSMYVWYRDASVCYAFLENSPDSLDTASHKDSFRGNRWFMRGWTLQELLAPEHMVFFSGNWQVLGEKKTISPLLATITGIENAILMGDRPVTSASVAKRMSWAAHRHTTRPEDAAYCLMGVFDVNMPMLYGEGGERAFLRLQEEIMKVSDDQSLFAWADLDASPDDMRGLLATSPAAFAYSNSMLPYQDWEGREPFTMTNRGLCIQLHLTLRDDLFVATLDCPVPPDYPDSSFLAIYLRKLSVDGQHYARTRVAQIGNVQQRGQLKTIYVRQAQRRPIEEEGVFPQHFLQLRSGPPTDVYRVVRVLLPPVDDSDRPILEEARDLVLRQPPLSWMTKGWPIVFRLLKGVGQVSAAVVFRREGDDEMIAILIGSISGFQVAFDAIELDVEEEEPLKDLEDLTLKELADKFEPSAAGRFEREYHSVRVSASPIVHSSPKDLGSSKYFLIDIGIEDVKFSIRRKLIKAAKAAKAADATILLSNESSGQGNLRSKKSSRFWKRLMS